MGKDLTGTRCRIKPSAYFHKKYGTFTPEISIEGTDLEVCGRSWMVMDGNPAALLYAMRSGLTGLPLDGTVYYGKIQGLGEFVHEDELEEM